MAVSNSRDNHLRAAFDASVIDASTYERLMSFFAERRCSGALPFEQAPRFDFANVLWYMGALIVLSAMTLFTTHAFDLWGPKALIATSIVYAVGFAAAGAYLWHRRGLRTPGGLPVTCAVGMVPLLIYAIQAATGNEPNETQTYHDTMHGANGRNEAAKPLALIAFDKMTMADSEWPETSCITGFGCGASLVPHCHARRARSALSPSFGKAKAPLRLGAPFLKHAHNAAASVSPVRMRTA